MNRVIEEIGFTGAMRYTALFIGILEAFMCALIKSRLPRKKWDPNLKWFELGMLIDKKFGTYTVGAFLVT